MEYLRQNPEFSADLVSALAERCLGSSEDLMDLGVDREKFYDLSEDEKEKKRDPIEEKRAAEDADIDDGAKKQKAYQQ